MPEYSFLLAQFVARIKIDPSSILLICLYIRTYFKQTYQHVLMQKQSIVNWFVFVFSRFMKFARVIKVNNGGKFEQIICTRDKVSNEHACSSM